MGICKLCLHEKELLKKSHIVPDFMYERLFYPKGLSNKKYKKKEKIYMIKFEDNNLRLTNNNVQTSPKEPDIICHGCDEVILSQLENYFKTNLLNCVRESYKNIKSSSKEIEVIFDVDYQKIKLFFLSLFWRFSISNNYDYNVIDLGEHQEIIRKMILENYPKGDHDYPFFLFSFLNRDNFFKDEPVTRLSMFLDIKEINQGKEYWILFPDLILCLQITSMIDDHFINKYFRGNDKVPVFYYPEKILKNIINNRLKKPVF